MPRQHKKRLPTHSIQTQIEKLSHDGRGIAHVDGKITFIFGGLPGEVVCFRYLSRNKRFDEGIVVEVIQAAPERVTARCAHFGVCGGCSIQHLVPEAQIELKQQLLLEQLQHIGKVQPQQVMPPLSGLKWGYRRKARLTVKYVTKKQSLLIGFREQRSHLVAELRRCEVLHPTVGEHLLQLRHFINQFEARDKIAQIEVAVGDTHTALIFRNLAPLSQADERAFQACAEESNIYLYLQPGGLDSIIPLWPHDLPLSSLNYYLSSEHINIQFAPQDFTQINNEVNQQMVPQAIAWLSPQPHERILELFCGLGNFTLPLAKRAAEVFAVDGDAHLLQRAQTNALAQGIHNIRYQVADLSTMPLFFPQHSYTKILLDPPRSGALELMRSLDFKETERIVYVSCNPATLARDAGELVHQRGFQLRQVGVMDMFPHTAHVEVMALFERL